jgi:hypothetical protein
MASIPVTRWNFKGEDRKHIGPMAQDIFHTLKLGREETMIDGGDLQGASLAAIQGLYEMLHEKDAEIDALRERIEQLEKQ